MANPLSPKLEAVPPFPPIIIISDSPVFHLIGEEEAQTQDTQDLSQDLFVEEY